MFFFVPNPWLSFFEIQGHERFPGFALFGLVPVVLAIISMFAATGRFSTRIGLTLCLPLFGYATYLLTWLTGVNSAEELMGFWLLLLPSVLVYLGGVAIAALLFGIAKRITKATPEQPPAR
jgi:hypothetical protein